MSLFNLGHEEACREVSKALFERLMEREDIDQLTWLMSEESNCNDVQTDEVEEIERVMMRADYVCGLLAAVDDCTSSAEEHQLRGDTWEYRTKFIKQKILDELDSREILTAAK